MELAEPACDDTESPGDSFDSWGRVGGSIIEAAPWCYGFHVRVSLRHCAGYGFDDGHDEMVGTVHRPDQTTLQYWLDEVVRSIDIDMPMDGAWSPARSLEVSWADGHHFHRAEVSENAYDLNVEMDMQRADVHLNLMNIDSVIQPAIPLPRLRHKLMEEWCEDHWKFMSMCWERCSKHFTPRQTETRANAVYRQMMIDFIQSENKEHMRALAMANKWWRTYESLLTPKRLKTDVACFPVLDLFPAHREAAG